MKKIMVLVLVFLLSIACLSGYVFLNKLVFEGSLKIIAGEKQITEGELKLKNGKARLASGEQQLSNGKKTYHQMNQATFLEVASAVALPVMLTTVAVTKVTGDKVSEGDRLVAQGRQKIKAGEEKLAAGKKELQRGINRLNQAKQLRFLCACGAIFFAILFLGLAYYWRPKWTKQS